MIRSVWGVYRGVATTMTAHTEADLRPTVQAALSRAIARRDVPDEVIDSVVRTLTDLHMKYPIRWIDVCVYGICIDQFIEPDRFPELIADLIHSGPIRKIDLFPWGIINPDLIQVHIE